MDVFILKVVKPHFAACHALSSLTGVGQIYAAPTGLVGFC